MYQLFAARTASAQPAATDFRVHTGRPRVAVAYARHARANIERTVASTYGGRGGCVICSKIYAFSYRGPFTVRTTSSSIPEAIRLIAPSKSMITLFRLVLREVASTVVNNDSNGRSKMLNIPPKVIASFKGLLL